VYIIKDDETGAAGGKHAEKEKCLYCYVGKHARKR
jgi:hypothetical protein